MLVEYTRAVRILIEMRHAEACLQLAANLLLHGVRKLHPVVRFQHLPHQSRVFRGVKGKGAELLPIVFVHKEEVDSIVQSGKQNTTRLEHPLGPTPGSTP